MAVTEKQSLILAALTGHFCLVVSIVADYFRRNSDGVSALSLGAIGVVALVAGAIIFVRQPRLFFLRDEENGLSDASPGPAKRIVAWVLVVAPPVLWLVAIDRLSDIILHELPRRLVGSYLFFAWLAIAIILSPHLFGRRQRR